MVVVVRKLLGEEAIASSPSSNTYVFSYMEKGNYAHVGWKKLCEKSDRNIYGESWKRLHGCVIVKNAQQYTVRVNQRWHNGESSYCLSPIL